MDLGSYARYTRVEFSNFKFVNATNFPAFRLRKTFAWEFVYISITNSNAVLPSRSLIQRLSLKAESFEKSSGMDRLLLVLLLPS